MLVKYWMNREVNTVEVNDSMQHAVTLMREHRTRLLPVLKKGKLVGVVTDRDLKRASASDATSLDIQELLYIVSKIKVGDIMTDNPITVPPDYTLEETAAQLLMNDISGAPVVDGTGRILGTISQREIFLALISLTGYGQQGIQLAFQVEDRPGSIKEVTDIIREFGGRLVSLLTSSSRAPVGHRYLYVRSYDIDRKKMPQLLEVLKQKGTLLYTVDHRENEREEYVESRPVT